MYIQTIVMSSIRGLNFEVCNLLYEMPILCT